MQIKVSIITINYNNSVGLRKTIESVVSQTFKHFEFIIIDGGSNNEDLDIIKAYHKEIDYWVSEKDSGVYHAMNKGIIKAQGEYLSFMNSGDYFFDKNVLANVFNKPHDADFLCGRCAIVSNETLVHITNPPEVHTFSTYYYNTINHQSTFIKKAMFEKFGLYREDFKYNSDWEFWIKTIILNNRTTEKLDMIICKYNLEGISAIENQTNQYKSEVSDVLSHPLLSKFVPDYELWRTKNLELKPLYWIKSRKVIFQPLLFLYKIAQFIDSIKKRYIKN